MRDSNRKEMKGKGQGRDKETITELKGKRWYTNEYTVEGTGRWKDKSGMKGNGR